MQKKVNQQIKYYFSERLKRQLEQISHHPLTIVEAPSGFGKTTTVREYLNDMESMKRMIYEPMMPHAQIL